LFTGNLRQFHKDQLGFLTRCARDYGDVVRLRFLHLPTFLLSHPDNIEYVLATNSSNFVKPKSVRLPLQRLTFGKGLLSSEGKDWLVRRRQIQHPLQRESISQYAELIVAHTERMIAAWDGRQNRDLFADMRLLTLGIAADIFFGEELDSNNRDMALVLKSITDMFGSLGGLLGIFHHYLPTETNRTFRRHIKAMDRIILRIINQRRLNNSRNDVLSTLLRCRHVDGKPLSDKEIRDEVMTLFMAGHETSAIALAWTFYLLTQHPEVESRLFAELRSVLGTRAPGAVDLGDLKFTEMVIKESMRLYPPNRSVGREALKECEIGGYLIPRGAQLIMSQWVVHRDKRYFRNPEEFIPERWEEGRSKALPKYAYFPFGGGPRMCFGKSIALMEMSLILATVVQRFSIDLLPGSLVKPRPAILLRPHGGVNVQLRSRLLTKYATTTSNKHYHSA
jgi:cytochrome P450